MRIKKNCVQWLNESSKYVCAFAQRIIWIWCFDSLLEKMNFRSTHKQHQTINISVQHQTRKIGGWCPHWPLGTIILCSKELRAYTRSFRRLNCYSIVINFDASIVTSTTRASILLCFAYLLLLSACCNWLVTILNLINVVIIFWTVLNCRGRYCD